MDDILINAIFLDDENRLNFAVKIIKIFHSQFILIELQTGNGGIFDDNIYK